MADSWVVAGAGEDPALGAPVEYINLKGTTYDNPAVCKYTGNKFYSVGQTAEGLASLATLPFHG